MIDLVEKISLKDGTGVLDYGVQSKAAWDAGTNLILQMMKGKGIVNIDFLLLKGYRVPTLDLYMDYPSDLEFFEKKYIDDLECYIFDKAKTSIIIADYIPQSLGNAKSKKNILLKKSSINEAIFRAYLCMLETMKEARETFDAENVKWSYGSIVLPAICEDTEEMKTRYLTMEREGSLISIFVRSDDDTIKKQKMSKRGELRFHNLVSANTFSFGKVSEKCFSFID